MDLGSNPADLNNRKSNILKLYLEWPTDLNNRKFNILKLYLEWPERWNFPTLGVKALPFLVGCERESIFFVLFYSVQFFLSRAWAEIRDLNKKSINT